MSRLLHPGNQKLAILCYFSTLHMIYGQQQNRLIPELIMILKFMNFEKKVHETKQKVLTVSAYYSELQTL